MKNTVLLGLLAVGISSQMSATTLTPEQALSRFAANKPHRMASSSSISSSELQLQSTIENLYIFSGEKGFVVLPAEDAAPVMLGYSDSDDFDIEGNPALRDWLDFYNKELSYLKNNPNVSEVSLNYTRKTRPEFKQLLPTKGKL